jgi:TctA family transporter
VDADQEVSLADDARETSSASSSACCPAPAPTWRRGSPTRCRSASPRTPEKFGTGHVEGLVEAGASNNASIASGWVPSLLFGIPGDTIAAIAIGVLYMKGLNPGPTLFTEKASSMYAIYLMFIIANIIMIPFGIIMIRMAVHILRAPRSSVMPVIMLCCAVGSFAIGNNLFGVITVASFGIIGYVMEENGYPVAAMVLGIVMGTMVEQAFVTSLIKSDGSILPFFERPISAILAACTIAAFAWPRWSGYGGSCSPPALFRPRSTAADRLTLAVQLLESPG